MIDPYDTYHNKVGVGIVKDKEEGNEWKTKAYEVLKDYDDKITWIEDLSENVHDQVPSGLDFLYIDGSHRFEYVMKAMFARLYKIKTKVTTNKIITKEEVFHNLAEFVEGNPEIMQQITELIHKIQVENVVHVAA